MLARSSSSSWSFHSLSCPPQSSIEPPKAALSTARHRRSHSSLREAPPPSSSSHPSRESPSSSSSSISRHRGRSGLRIGQGALPAIKSASSRPWSIKMLVGLRRIAVIIERAARAQRDSLRRWDLQRLRRGSSLILIGFTTTISRPECRPHQCLILNQATFIRSKTQ